MENWNLAFFDDWMQQIYRNKKFGLVVFYDMSTLVGYLMLNLIYTYYIWFVSE